MKPDADEGQLRGIGDRVDVVDLAVSVLELEQEVRRLEKVDQATLGKAKRKLS